MIKFSALILLSVALAALSPQLAGPASASISDQTIHIDSQKKRENWITGRVVIDSGQPGSNAEVYITKAGAFASSSRTITAADDGTFRADDLPPGAYSVSASVPGYVPEADPLSREYYRLGEDVTIRLVKGGVITGTVTDSSGEPLVAITVAAIRVRDAEGRPLHALAQSGSSRNTDDRGVYRIYGLRAGSYVVRAGGVGQTYDAFGGDAPVYYPSSTRDTAAQVDVSLGGETSGIDIRYRSERGHIVSGSVSGSFGENKRFGLSVLLSSAAGATEGSAYVSPSAGRTFAIYGVTDGEHILTSSYYSDPSNPGGWSGSKRITVKGADVTGVDLALTPAASLAGRVLLERLPESERKDECKSNPASLDELILRARRDEKFSGPEPPMYNSSISDGIPDEKGEFRTTVINPGRYRLELWLPSESWFVRSITQGSTGRGKQAVDIAGAGISITQGQRVSDLLVNISEGAAGLRGKVVSPSQGQTLPDHLRLYLVPAEPESLDDIFRFAESAVESDGGFALKNLAPGRYYAVVRKLSDAQAMERNPQPLAWDSSARAKLQRDAQAANVVVELQRCKVTTEYVIKYSPVSAKAPARNDAQ